MVVYDPSKHNIYMFLSCSLISWWKILVGGRLTGCTLNHLKTMQAVTIELCTSNLRKIIYGPCGRVTYINLRLITIIEKTKETIQTIWPNWDLVGKLCLMLYNIECVKTTRFVTCLELIYLSFFTSFYVSNLRLHKINL